MLKCDPARAALCAHWRVRAGRNLYRAGGAGNGHAQQAARDLPALKSDQPQRSGPSGLDELDRGAGTGGYGNRFPTVKMGGSDEHTAQTNNSYIFPGLALGIVASKARRVTETMIKAAAQELVRHVPTQKDKQASLLPPLCRSPVSCRVNRQSHWKASH